MTPKFITPCYVRVDDARQRQEVCEKLDKLGYEVCYCVTMSGEPKDCQCFVFNTLAGYIHIRDISNFEDGDIDCGTNVELFLSLAGMRKDTDMGQLYIASKDTEAPSLIWGEMFKSDKHKCKGFMFQDPRPRGKKYFIGLGLIRPATITEIIEYFKK